MWPAVWKPPEVWEQSTQKKPSLLQPVSLSDMHLICNIKNSYINESEEKYNQYLKLHPICSSLYFPVLGQEIKYPDGNKHF